jgi:hypothetical protein
MNGGFPPFLAKIDAIPLSRLIISIPRKFGLESAVTRFQNRFSRRESGVGGLER